MPKGHGAIGRCKQDPNLGTSEFNLGTTCHPLVRARGAKSMKADMGSVLAVHKEEVLVGGNSWQEMV